MKLKTIFALLVLCATATSCTDNYRAKHLGGTETIKLNSNEVVLSVTWKDTEMWICTRDTTTGVVYFREKSNWGIHEGTVILK